MFSLLVVVSGHVEINELYIPDMEEDARNRFKEIIREKWKSELSANNCPPVDDQCWKDILDTGRFSIRNIEFYLTVIPILRN